LYEIAVFGVVLWPRNSLIRAVFGWGNGGRAKLLGMSVSATESPQQPKRRELRAVRGAVHQASDKQPILLDVIDGDVPQNSDTETPVRRNGVLNYLKETAIIMASALIVSWLIKTFLVQAFFIPSESMENTLDIGDRVMVSRLVPRVFSVHRGDIVVFKDPGDWLEYYIPPVRTGISGALTTGLTWIGLFPQDSGDHLIKRAIGIPGDRVACCDYEGRVTINGIPISEELYLRPGSIPSQDPFDVTVPPDMLFVMGDNRQNSADSRYNQDKPYDGFVPLENVVGTAFTVVWPLNHFQWLRNPGSVFAPVGQ